MKNVVTISTSLLRKELGTSTYTRGLDYYDKQYVDFVTFDTQNSSLIVLKSHVQGCGKHSYEQFIDWFNNLYEQNSELDIRQEFIAY